MSAIVLKDKLYCANCDQNTSVIDTDGAIEHKSCKCGAIVYWGNLPEPKLGGEGYSEWATEMVNQARSIGESLEFDVLMTALMQHHKLVFKQWL